MKCLCATSGIFPFVTRENEVDDFNKSTSHDELQQPYTSSLEHIMIEQLVSIFGKPEGGPRARDRARTQRTP